jgi:hypothetical protein
VIGGEIKTFTVRGESPVILYQDRDSSTQIASAFHLASHAYVVDKIGQVWDPITRMWGGIGEEEYLSRLKTKSGE